MQVPLKTFELDAQTKRPIILQDPEQSKLSQMKIRDAINKVNERVASRRKQHRYSISSDVKEAAMQAQNE